MSIKICPHCQKQIENDAVYCENCGTRVSTDSEEPASRYTAPRKRSFRRIVIYACVFLGTIAVSIFILVFSHQWRWDETYGRMNSSGIGAYRNADRTAYGLYHYHWYGYEDLTKGYTLDGVQVTDSYFATKDHGSNRWVIHSKCLVGNGWSTDLSPDDITDILPLFHFSNGKTYQDLLFENTGMLLVKQDRHWGTVSLKRFNTLGIDRGLDFQYEDMYTYGDAPYLICKKDELWGMLYMNEFGDIIASIPNICTEPEVVKEILDNKNIEGRESYIVTSDWVPHHIVHRIYNKNKISTESTGMGWNCCTQLEIDFTYGGYAFYSIEDIWYCIDLCKLKKRMS